MRRGEIQVVCMFVRAVVAPTVKRVLSSRKQHFFFRFKRLE